MNFGKKSGRLLAFLVVIVCTAAVSSCTFMGIARNYADWIITGRLDDAFDLSGDQKQFIKQRLPAYLEFLDTELVPDAVIVLSKLKLSVKTKLTVEDTVELRTAYENLRIKMFDFLADDAGEFLMTLNDDQLKHFKKYLAKKNSYEVKMLKKSDDDLRQAELEKKIEFLEKWLGDFSREQVAVIQRIHAPSRTLVEQRLARKRGFQNAIYDLAVKKPGAEAIAGKIRAWAREPGKMLRSESAQSYKQHLDRYQADLLAVDAMISAEQRSHLQDELQKLISTLSSIARPRVISLPETKKQLVPGE